MGEEKETQTVQDTILYIRQQDSKDGYAEVHISPDKIKATAHFYPPASGGDFLTYFTVSQRLSDAGITSGVLHDTIQEAIFKTNSTKKPQKDILIAKGTQAITEIPEHYVIRSEFLERKPEIDPSAARVDWHSISAFSIVHLKEPIARRIPKVDGVKGLDIYGQETNYAVKSMPVFSAGANIVTHEKGFFAGKNGRLSIDSSGVLSIEEVLTLKTGVDFSTGNITFPGDVILQGKVADGFKIYSGGSIISSEVFDVTEVVCKKNLVIQAGIEGRGKGTARVGGSLTAKYIQNCRIAVRGDINVSGSIMQSTVYSMGSIKMGQTGKLVGCECIVIGGVQALEIGNSRGVKTRIRCGTNFTVQQELDIANEQLKILAVKIQKAEEALAEEESEELVKHLETLNAKKAEINARIPLYLPKIDTNDQAAIEVFGTLFPGTEIEICHIAYTVTKPEKQVVLRLDKARGIITSESLKGKK